MSPVGESAVRNVVYSGIIVTDAGKPSQTIELYGPGNFAQGNYKSRIDELHAMKCDHTYLWKTGRHTKSELLESVGCKDE
ncbi:hypothetical protein J4226_05660 [Candidatus Pacearchaeota archaeon]|nr:hypothetical protein [Candidatus Pacearchaeota archaeon]